ncbi:hypothetical protein ACP0SJ_08245 [Campylobacter jejuni]
MTELAFKRQNDFFNGFFYFFDFWVFFERISISVSKSWISDLVILNLSLRVKN